MGRPQEIDFDQVLEHAQAIWMADGMSAVTTRALSARSGVSNGAIYHHFGSRNHLLAQVWAREAAAFRTFQREQIRQAREGGTPQDAVVAAALVTGGYADVKPQAVRVLLASRPDVIPDDGLPDPVKDQLRDHRSDAAQLITELALEVWDRDDEVARTLMRYCVVDIPARLFMASRRPNDPLARFAIEHAVRGLLAAGPPPA